MTFPENVFRKTGIIMAKARTYPRPSPHTDIFAEMKIGDTHQTDDDSRVPCSCAHGYGIRHGKKFTTKRSGAGYLITRIE